MNFRFYFICLISSAYWEVAHAANNTAWNCEQSKSGEWTCLNQENPATETPKPPITPATPIVANPAEPEVSNNSTTQPIQPKIATPAATAITAPINQVPSASLPIEQPVAPQALPTTVPAVQQAKPAIPVTTPESSWPVRSTPAETALSVNKVDEPPKPRVHVSENQHPHLQKVEPEPEQASSTAGLQSGWTCQSGGDKQNWNCNLVGADPKGQAQPVIGTTQNNIFGMAPTFSASQERTFQELREEFPRDPWQNCQNWAIKKTRIKSPSAAVRENAITDVTADFSEAFQGEVLSFAGDVDLTRADQHLRAEKASYDTSAGTLDAQGHVMYSESSIALASESLAMNLNTDEARIRQAMFIAGDGPIRGSAEAIYRDDKYLSRYNDAAVSSCAPGNQDWIMHASRLKINRDIGQGSAKDAWLEFKGIPVIYTPYISFPTDNRRLSGFMPPNWGSTQRGGFYVSAPFYWNIAPNMDSTIIPRYFSSRGPMLSDQFRYLTEISKGTIGAEYMPYDQKLHKPRYSFGFKDNSIFTQSLKSQVDVNLVSDRTYFNDLNNALGFQRNSYLSSNGTLNYLQPNHSVTLGMQHYQSVDPTIDPKLFPYDVLPMASFNGVHNFAGLPLRVGLSSQYSNFYHPKLVNGQRFMISPSISAPFESTAGFFIPKVSLQSTQYQLSNQNPLYQTVAGLPSNINRTLPIFSVDSGLSLEKPMQFAGNAYNNILEPRLFYLYIPRKDQRNIPIFDTTAYDPNFNSLFRENAYSGYDRLQDANQLTIAGTSRYVDSITGLEPLKVSLGQTFYFQDRTVTLTSYNQNTVTPIQTQTSKTSNLIADISGQINQHLSYVTAGQWNTESNSFARGQVGFKYRDQPDRILDLSYRFRSATANPLVPSAVVPGTAGTTNIPANISLTDVSFRWPLFDEWYALGRWQYSLNFNKTLESFIGLEKENCCWRFRIIGRRYINGATTNSVGITPNLAPENAFFVELDLKGLSGLGDDVDTFLQTSLNGYRKAGYY